MANYCYDLHWWWNCEYVCVCVDGVCLYRLALSRSKQSFAALPLFMCLLLDGNRLDTITNHNLTQWWWWCTWWSCTIYMHAIHVIVYSSLHHILQHILYTVYSRGQCRNSRLHELWHLIWHITALHSINPLINIFNSHLCAMFILSLALFSENTIIEVCLSCI